jgi:hypothetical protein
LDKKYFRGCKMEHNQELIKEHITTIAELGQSAKSAHHRLDGNDKRLDAHDEQIKELSCAKASNEQIVKSLCDKLDGLINTIKWLIGLLVPSMLTLAGLMITVLIKK